MCGSCQVGVEDRRWVITLSGSELSCAIRLKPSVEHHRLMMAKSIWVGALGIKRERHLKIYIKLDYALAFNNTCTIQLQSPMHR